MMQILLDGWAITRVIGKVVFLMVFHVSYLPFRGTSPFQKRDLAREGEGEVAITVDIRNHQEQSLQKL